MKKVLLTLLLINYFAFGQVGIGTLIPTGALDINSALPLPSVNKAGLVPPTVALSATNSLLTTTAGVSVVNPETNLAPITGTIVYNTNNSVAGANQVTAGYYFYNGTTWEKITSGANNNWTLSGNTGTTPATNYIGTNDTQPLAIKTDNVERIRVDATGKVGIGTPTASQKLSVRHDQDGAGVMSVDNATAGGFSGIYFQQNTAYRGHIGYVNTGGTSSFGGKGFYQLASGDRPILFSVGPAGSELFSERMRINQVGNVGINSTNPTAKLEIDASTDTYPALEIVPRTTAPTGTASGQISVIDGSLYIYDAVRTKWLSSETITYSFGVNGNSDNSYLQFARVPNGLSGAKILKDATIIGITAVSSGGVATKLIQINGSTLGNAFTDFNLAANQYIDSLTDVNLPAGENINVFVANAGNTVADLTVTVYLKWRK